MTDRSLKLIAGIVVVTVTLLIQVASPFSVSVSASNVLDRSVQLETARPSDVGRHNVQFTITDFGTAVGSLRFEYCQNDPIIESPCVPPAGFDISGATLIDQVGETGFSIDSVTANEIVVSRPASLPTTGPVRYELDGVVNPSFLGSFYTRLYTYPTEDGSGPATQTGGVALSTTIDINVEAEVPPYLTFCVAITIAGFDCSNATSFFTDLGELSTSSTSTASSQMIAATNAAGGYNIRVNGTTLTSGNNIIPSLSSQAVSQAGVSQFGMNLRSNTNPAVGANTSGPGSAVPRPAYNSVNQFRFVPNDVVASSPIASDFRKFTSSYIVNISEEQAPGIYTTTISYLALANF